MEKFIVESRYQTLTSEGKKFTNWFIFNSDPMSEEEANNIIKDAKILFDYIDKKTKLKHEYRLSSYEDYLKNQKELNKEANKAIKDREKYVKSDAYKELQKKKRQSNKELKERQKKYLESIK